MVVDEVFEAIIEELWVEHVSKQFPKTEDQFRQKILDSEELWQFPCYWGHWAAIDGCRIPMESRCCQKYLKLKCTTKIPITLFELY